MLWVDEIKTQIESLILYFIAKMKMLGLESNG